MGTARVDCDEQVSLQSRSSPGADVERDSPGSLSAAEEAAKHTSGTKDKGQTSEVYRDQPVLQAECQATDARG